MQCSMRRSSRNPERIDELRDRPKPSADELNATICRQAMRIKQLEQQVADLSERETARLLRAVVNLLGLRYAYEPRYLHTTFTDETRRELAELLRPVIDAERQEEGSDE